MLMTLWRYSQGAMRAMICFWTGIPASSKQTEFAYKLYRVRLVLLLLKKQWLFSCQLMLVVLPDSADSLAELPTSDVVVQLGAKSGNVGTVRWNEPTTHGLASGYWWLRSLERSSADALGFDWRSDALGLRRKKRSAGKRRMRDSRHPRPLSTRLQATATNTEKPRMTSIALMIR